MPFASPFAPALGSDIGPARIVPTIDGDLLMLRALIGQWDRDRERDLTPTKGSLAHGLMIVDRLLADHAVAHAAPDAPHAVAAE